MVENLTSTLGGLFGFGLIGAGKALLLAVLAFVLGTLIQEGFEKLLGKASFLKERENASDIISLFGKLIYLSVLLLFIPGICSALGASSIADPILDMLRKLWTFLPNIIGSCVLLLIGYHVAKLVRQLLVPFIEKIVPATAIQKLGMDTSCVKKSVEAIAYIVYIAILVPVCIASLQVLDLTSLTRPAVVMLQRVLAFIPNILAFIFILVIGFMFARLFGRFVETAVSAAGLDDKVQKFIGDTKGFSLSKLLGRMVHFLIVVFFTVEALNILHMAVLTSIGKAIIGYLPNVVASVIVLLLAWMATGAVGRVMAVNKMHYGVAIIKTVIYVIAGFMVLSQLSIAPHIVNTAFILLLTGFVIAFAIAVGFGAKDVVRMYLERKLNESCCKEEPETEEAEVVETEKVE